MSRPCYVVSFEGALASCAWRKEVLCQTPNVTSVDWDRYYRSLKYDAPNREMMEVIAEFAEETQASIYVVSVTPAKFSQRIVDWLAEHKFVYHAIRYRDNNVSLPDDMMKRKLFEETISFMFPKKDTTFFESCPSAVEMWSALGFDVEWVKDPHLDPLMPAIVAKEYRRRKEMVTQTTGGYL